MFGFLAATNQDLENAVAEGHFREDLTIRLNVIHLLVPPLRERASEIPLLASYFVERYAKLYRPRRVHGSAVGDGAVSPPTAIPRQRSRAGESDQTK
jgi:DNA-binding NtrC family response regulator